MISSENDGKITEHLRFPWAVCRKGVGSNSILYHFCRSWVHNRYSGIKGKLKDDSKVQMSDMCKSANKYNRGLSRQRGKW